MTWLHETNSAWRKPFVWMNCKARVLQWDADNSFRTRACECSSMDRYLAPHSLHRSVSISLIPAVLSTRKRKTAAEQVYQFNSIDLSVSVQSSNNDPVLLRSYALVGTNIHWILNMKSIFFLLPTLNQMCSANYCCPMFTHTQYFVNICLYWDLGEKASKRYTWDKLKGFCHYPGLHDTCHTEVAYSN